MRLRKRSVSESESATQNSADLEEPLSIEEEVVDAYQAPEPQEEPEAGPEPSPEPIVAAIAEQSIEDHGGKGVSDAPNPLASATDAPKTRIIAVANQKGGVGKTTTVINLGSSLAEKGYHILIVDLDPQGNATTGLGVDPRNFEHSVYDVLTQDTPIEDVIEATSVERLSVVPSTIHLAGADIELVPAFSRELKLKNALDRVKDDYDFILIDCPPSLSLITINGLAAATEVLVPIQCEYYALEGLAQLIRNVHLVAGNLNPSLEISLIVLTMYDSRTSLARDVATEVREHFPEKVCETVIPRTVRLSEAPSFGQPINVFDPSSRGAKAYRSLAEEVSHGTPQRAR